jgi:extracellular elastinolytic metalloproteinase
VTLTLDANGEVTLLIEDVVTNLDPNGGPVDNCGLSTSITLSQELFTCDDRGANVITVTLTDTDGNTSNCTPTVTINDPLDVCPPLGTEDNEFDQNLNIFPNPSNGQITIANNSNFEIRSAIIMDINGRTVQNLNVENMGNQTKFSIEKLADGTYFIKIDADNVSVVKRILKN